MVKIKLDLRIENEKDDILVNWLIEKTNKQEILFL